MKDLMMRALDLAQVRKAQYADVRIVQTTTESMVVKNGVVTELNRQGSGGFGVRLLVDGAWGFASSRSLSSDEVDRVTDLAFKIARASALVAAILVLAVINLVPLLGGLLNWAVLLAGTGALSRQLYQLHRA